LALGGQEYLNPISTLKLEKNVGYIEILEFGFQENVSHSHLKEEDLYIEQKELIGIEFGEQISH